MTKTKNKIPTLEWGNKNYTDEASIPKHIFTNMACTETPCKELRKYLRWMLTHHPNDLEYLFRHSQRYVNYGGYSLISFDVWKGRLNTSLTNQKC